MKYFSWFMKSRNKFATCRGVDEHEYYDEWSGKFKTFKSKQWTCLLYTSPSPRDVEESRMPSSA